MAECVVLASADEVVSAVDTTADLATEDTPETLLSAIFGIAALKRQDAWAQASETQISVACLLAGPQRHAAQLRPKTGAHVAFQTSATISVFQFSVPQGNKDRAIRTRIRHHRASARDSAH